MPPSINNDYIKPRGMLKYRGGKPYAMAMMYETSTAKKYKAKVVKQVRQAVKDQGFIYNEGKFAIVEYVFYFPRTNMDTNNYYKCLVDAITESGVVWKDDNVSLMRDSRIYYDSVNPRVEIKIYYTDWIGIFDDRNELETFKNTYCNNCTRGNKIGLKGGCSVYKKALESRIQDEIDRDGIKKCLAMKAKK